MEEKILFYAELINGRNQAEKELQYQLIMQMIRYFQTEEVMDEDDFFLMVEDAPGIRPVSVNRAAQALLRTGAFLFDGESFRFNENLCIGKHKLSWEQFTDLFHIKTREKKPEPACDDKMMAIIKGIQWCVNMVQLAREELMQGLPAFLRCEAKDSLIGRNVAGTATSDALSLLCKGRAYISRCGIEPDILSSTFTFLLRKILRCQCLSEGWDKGGFLPLEDQPEAAHPTVDASCLAIMALCQFYTNRGTLENHLNIVIPVENQDIEEAVLSGVEFLFRMQQPGGSYGIYRFAWEHPGASRGNDKVDGYALPHENCTRMVLFTMGECRDSGIFEARGLGSLGIKCETYITQAYAYIKEHTAAVKGLDCLVWAPYFGRDAVNYPPADVVVSAARVCGSLLPVWFLYAQEREQIKKFYADFLCFWMEQKDKIQGQAGKYVFITPGKDRYSAGMYVWQSYPDMIAAFTVLQGYNALGIALSKDEWGFLEKTVEHVLDIQHPHGHWNLPSDGRTPFCAATLAAIELLREYRKAKEYM